MVWNQLEDFYKEVKENHGTFGKAWIGVLFTLRIFAVTTVGTAVYGDDFSSFICDTGQPGCKAVCFKLIFIKIFHSKHCIFENFTKQIHCICTN